MINKFKSIVLLTCFSLFLTGCSSAASPKSGIETATNTTEALTPADTSTIPETTISDTVSSDMFTDRDKEATYDEDNCTLIQLNNDGSLCDSSAVQINGQVVTITEEGTYLVSGNLTDGMLKIETSDTNKIHLILDNVSISNSNSAAIYIKEADKVFITLAPDSENTVSNGGSYSAIDDNNIDAVIFSKSDLTFNGNGRLTINAEEGHGIVSKDDLVITGGSYIISSVSHGISGKDSIRIADGNFTITSGKDGIQAENEDDTSLGFLYIANGTFDITAEDDGLSSSNYMKIENGSFQITSTDDALHAASDLTINNGNFQINAGDDGMHTDTTLNINGGTVNISQCYEGIEGLTIRITGGQIDITSSDDGLNAAGGNDSSGFNKAEGMRGKKDSFGAESNASIEISGGTINVNAEGDGIDSNGSLTISGGKTYVYGPTRTGNSSLDFGSEAIITGGVFAAFGPSQMAQNFSTNSTQGAIIITVGSQTAGSTFSLKDESGHEIFSSQPYKAYDCIIISCPEIIEGNTYTITAGASETSITMDSLIGGTNGNMNFNMPGNMKDHGGRPGNLPFDGTAPSDTPNDKSDL